MTVNVVPLTGPLQGFELLERGDVAHIGGRVWVSGRVSQDACLELVAAAELALKAQLPGAAWMDVRACCVLLCVRTHTHVRTHRARTHARCPYRKSDVAGNRCS